MKFVGGILFIFNTYVGAALLLVYQAILSPILYDFYNRDYDRDHFTVFYTKFKEVSNPIHGLKCNYNQYICNHYW